MVSTCAATGYDVSWVNGSPYVFLEARQPPRSSGGFFLIDTGANTSAVDRSWIEGLLGPVGETVTVPEFDFVITQREVRFHVQDLRHLHAVQGQPQVGTLGTDFLSRFAVDLSPGGPRLALVARDPRERCVSDWDALRAIPLRIYTATPAVTGPENIPTVELTLNGGRLPCQLDTGTDAPGAEASVSLNEAAFEQVRDALVLVEERTLSRTSDQTRVRVYKARSGSGLQASVSGEPLRIDRVLVQGPENGHPFSASTPQALAGMSVIRQWRRVVFDPFGQRLWVKSLARER